MQKKIVSNYMTYSSANYIEWNQSDMIKLTLIYF